MDTGSTPPISPPITCGYCDYSLDPAVTVCPECGTTRQSGQSLADDLRHQHRHVALAIGVAGAAALVLLVVGPAWMPDMHRATGRIGGIILFISTMVFGMLLLLGWRWRGLRNAASFGAIWAVLYLAPLLWAAALALAAVGSVIGLVGSWF